MPRHLRAAFAAAVGVAVIGVVSAAAAVASGSAGGAPARAADRAALFPTELSLPNGFQPEGIAIGALPFAFFGSRANGDLYRVNLVTGKGSVFSPGPGTPSLGMKLDLLGRLFVSGGGAGDARVVNAITGRVLARYAFASAPTFVNDVVLTRDAAWFTDSLNPVLYKLPLGRHGKLPDQDDVVRVPLGGAYEQVAGFNANGISRTPNGKALLVVQTATGILWRIDAATGDASAVDLGGEALTNGDGLLLSGRTLFVVRNQINTVAVVRLDAAGTSGRVVENVTDPRFDVPTTVASFANRLYLPNARFSTPPTPETPYTAVGIERP